MPAAPRSAATQSVDALIERVDNQASAIRNIADVSERDNANLRTEVNRVIAELGVSIRSNEAKIEAAAKLQAEQSRPQYFALFGGMIAAVGLAVTIIQWQSGLRDKPIDDKLTSLTQSIADLARTTSTAFSEVKQANVSENEFRLTADFEKQIGDLKTANRIDNEKRLEASVTKLASDTIPRQEDAEHWKGQERRDIADEGELGRVRERLNEVIKRFNDLSPTGDVLKDLADRQRDLDTKIGTLKQSLIPTGTIIAKPDKP